MREKRGMFSRVRCGVQRGKDLQLSGSDCDCAQQGQMFASRARNFGKLHRARAVQRDFSERVLHRWEVQVSRSIPFRDGGAELFHR